MVLPYIVNKFNLLKVKSYVKKNFTKSDPGHITRILYQLNILLIKQSFWL